MSDRVLAITRAANVEAFHAVVDHGDPVRIDRLGRDRIGLLAVDHVEEVRGERQIAARRDRLLPALRRACAAIDRREPRPSASWQPASRQRARCRRDWRGPTTASHTPCGVRRCGAWAAARTTRSVSSGSARSSAISRRSGGELALGGQHARHRRWPPSLDLANPDDISPAADLQAAKMLTARFPTVIAAHARLSAGKQPIAPRSDLPLAANFLYMVHGKEPDPISAQAIDTYWVTVIDHGMKRLDVRPRG